MKEEFRIEKDVLGELKVPKDAYYGINTQRALMNFQISGKKFPVIFIKSLAEIKKACLLANLELGLIDKEIGNAILEAVNEIIIHDKYLDQFPIDIYQTGSGTQTNMNMNEVLANRANELLGHERGKKYPVHPNDHVNKGQSSNDVIPATMHLSSLKAIHQFLLPSIQELKEVLERKIKDFKDIIKVGRTHLQDAVPMPLSLEFKVYLQQIKINEKRIKNALDELLFLPLGGTAVGTGINCHEDFPKLAISHLSKITGFSLKNNPVKAEGIASHNILAHVSSILRSLALSLMKMANDIRWMASGPRAGLAELQLPSNEPGSSIMPGKINPTQSEALIQAYLQVMGNDLVINSSEAHGSILDLNVCKPVIIYNLLDSIRILGNAMHSFINNCLIGIRPNLKQIQEHLERTLMLVTNLTPYLGYDKCAELAKKAYEEGKTIKEIIIEEGLTFDKNLDEILDPKNMIKKEEI
ncbi:MAG: class II fumarate hydratase [Promethearchaeota archaeon]